MRRGSYTYGEERAIEELAPLGAEYVALILDRDIECVRRKASRMGVSLAKSFEINVRNMSERQLKAITSLNPTMLCPSCAKRFVNTLSGVCDLCHLDALTTNHNAEYRRLSVEAERTYNTSKKRLSRLREELGVPAPRGKGGDA